MTRPRHLANRPRDAIRLCPGGTVSHPCKKAAGWGTDHPGFGRCARHGGREASEQEIAGQLEAQSQQRFYGQPEWVEPEKAIVNEIARAHGAVLWAETQLLELQRRCAGNGTEWLDDPVGYKLRKIYNEERERLFRLSRSAIDIGLQERQVRMAEQMGAVVCVAVLRSLEALGVDVASNEARQVVSTQLALAARGDDAEAA